MDLHEDYRAEWTGLPPHGQPERAGSWVPKHNNHYSLVVKEMSLNNQFTLHWNTWEHEAGTLIFLKMYPWKPFCIQELRVSKIYPRINKTVYKELITCWSIAFLYMLIDFKFSFPIFRMISIKSFLILPHSACVLTGVRGTL